MRFTVTPLAIRMERLATAAALLPTADRHIVLPADDYHRRGAFETEAEDAHTACERAWLAFQNLDHQATPDGGRSLMTGDMAEVVDAEGRVGHWICCVVGWTETTAPTNAIIEVTGATA